MQTSSSKNLIPAFILITSIIVLLGIISLFSMEQSSKAINNVVATGKFVQLAQKATTNLTMAGQLPRDLETISSDPIALRRKMDSLRNEFLAIKMQFTESALPGKGPYMLFRFIQSGEKYYAALAHFFPLKEQMAMYTSEYKGEPRTLVDVLSERELDHVRYVRALRSSVEQKKLLVGTLDHKECGFYKWYTDTPPKHAGVAAIIQDEVVPLHQSLHDYAARVAELLSKKDIIGAKAVLKKADEDLLRLGNYFSGLRDLAYTEQNAAQQAFAKQLTELRTIYAEAVQAAHYFETHLVKIEQEPALDELEKTTHNNRTLILLFAMLGTMISIFVAIVTYKKVRERSRNLEKTTFQLQEAKASITENRNKLQHAFDEVSQLIQEVSRGQNFNTRFENPFLAKCYEVMDCEQEGCVCHGQPPMRCWQLVGTICDGIVQGHFAKKFERCSNCPVFQQATADPVFLIGEHFNNMMTMLENKNLEIEELSITDQLTGLYNRRGFLSMASRQLGLAQRTKGEMLLLYTDFDNMKWINDTLGHNTGDLALVETADLLRETFRQTDIIGRMGGDEFAILFLCDTMERPECEQTILKRLWENLEECNRLENRNYEIAISLGVSWFDRKNPMNIEKLLSEADRFMYKEKRGKKQPSR